jgi:hypothetical protein
VRRGRERVRKEDTYVDEVDGGERGDEVDWRGKVGQLASKGRNGDSAPRVTISETVFAFPGLTAVRML